MFYSGMSGFIGMFHPGMSEMLIILFIAFLIFGAKRIPELGGALGKGIKNFQSGLRQGPKKDEEPQKLIMKESSEKKDEDLIK